MPIYGVPEKKQNIIVDRGAFFMSNLRKDNGSCDLKQKGKTPKVADAASFVAWLTGE